MSVVDVDGEPVGAGHLVGVRVDDDVADPLDPVDGAIGPWRPVVESERLACLESRRER
jgi:hypothetical protein